MFPQPFTRILWKEHRVQRPLWLTCLAIGVMLQVFVVVGSHINSTTRETDYRNLGMPLQAIATMMSIMYAVGCAAILFAGEREERTSDWLLRLSVPPGWTLAAKLVWAVGSILALQCVLSFPGFASGMNLQLDRSLVPFSLLVFVWALFGSLVSRRVLIAIGAMVGYWVLIYLIPVSTYRYVQELIYGRQSDWDYDLLHRQPVVLCTYALVIVADLWLGWRWCQGKYLDGSVVESWNAWFSNLLETRLRWAPKIRQLPNRAEYGQPWRRAWQRLVWQERTRERSHRFMLVMGVLLAAAFAIVSRLTRDVAMHPVVVFTLAIPLAMGVLGFRADSNWQQPRFLCNHGIAPAAIWSAKQVVWMTRAFVLTSVVFVTSTFFEWLVVENRGAPFAPFLELCKTIWKSPVLAVWFVLVGYSSGQLAACIFRRVVIAALFGVMVNIMMWAWVMWVTEARLLQLPQWWSIGLPVMAMLLLTLWQTTHWLLEDNSFMRFFRLTVSLMAPPIVMSSFFVVFRIIQIQPAPIDAKVEQAWRSLTRRPKLELSSNEKSVLGRLIALSQPIPDPTVQNTDEIATLLKSDLNSLNDPKEPDWESARLSPFAVKRLLQDRARELESSGEIAIALDYLMADLRLNRLLAVQRPFQLWRGLSGSQRSTLDMIVKLANHPSQTVESIREIMRIVADELSRFPAQTEAIIASYEQDRRLWVDSSTSQLCKTILFQIQQTEMPPFFYLAISLARERTRLGLLVTRESQLAFARAQSLESQFQSQGRQKPIWQAITDDLEDQKTTDWATTTVLMRFVRNSYSEVAEPIYSRVAMKRAAMTCLAIISYRKQHGHLPAKLFDLGDLTETENLIDPYSNQRFDYYPGFLLSEGEYHLSIRPVTATEAELDLQWAGKPPVRLNVQQLMSAAKDDIESTIESITKAKAELPLFLTANIYSIPVENGEPPGN